ncbi:uncharacterized protein N7529_006506 [Penicillium soppii]|jgi:hypothetical protein|uniref:uncharacterized protein n=1 Tax=Penicillium soppii TaxID=69789 RepID=UPI0025469191|nr:uncharacterized protein N7529_006506 [Penicillium soppii]KAJ5864590.1 hypothetical protein N7529_006506 [Penicillium soppii]
MTPALSRRKHLKSRNGCIQCKKRKIKCDENGSVPCAQCVKSRHTCSFTPPPPLVDSNFSTSALLDLKLLHNFTTKTSQTLSGTSEVRACLSTGFIELAMQHGHEYLLHCILALSAFHIVNQQENRESSQPPQVEDHPKEVYLQAAYKHHESALKGYRHSLSTVSPASCHGIFGCAILLFITTFARPPDSALQLGQPQNSTNVGVWLSFHLSEWVILIKGLPSIVAYNEFRTALYNGPLATLMNAQSYRSADVQTSPQREAVSCHLHHLSEGIRVHSSNDTNIQVCLPAIETLRQVVTELNHSNDHALAFLWPIRVTPEYLTLLEAKVPEALVVFAYYCAILYITSSTWWTKGWPRPILESIRETIDKKWNSWLSWPLDLVFHNPEKFENGLLPVPTLPSPIMYNPR